jgi:rod shape determining protein RodA
MTRVMQFMFGPPGGLTVLQKLGQVSWSLIFLITLVSSIGFAMLYSAAGGSMEPWAGRQMMRFGFGMAVLLVVALIDIRVWYRFAYLFFVVALSLLVAVELAGRVGMGAQRWLDLGPVALQPTELMKIALILALARYFHGMSHQDVGRPMALLVPAMMVLVPAALVTKQPDLGSGILLSAAGGVIFLMAGVRIWMFAVLGAGLAAAAPIAWQFLREYQRQRVLTFLNPETDPLGAGYHIIQSTIAIGSGGLFGKGYLQGTQAHLQFLPERQTDFIFTMFCEEFGLLGAAVLIGLYTLILLYGVAIATRTSTQFGRLTAIGVVTSFYIYALINMAMVTGLMPVVGEPLPFVSWGGSAMVSLLFSFGLLINVLIHREVRILPRVQDDD